MIQISTQQWKFGSFDYAELGWSFVVIVRSALQLVCKGKGERKYIDKRRIKQERNEEKEGKGKGGNCAILGNHQDFRYFRKIIFVRSIRTNKYLRVRININRVVRIGIYRDVYTLCTYTASLD